MIVRMFPNNAGRALGFIGLGASVGFFIGPIYAGWRAGAHWKRYSVRRRGGDRCWSLVCWESWRRACLRGWRMRSEPSQLKPSTNAPAQKLFPTGALWVCFIASAFAFCLRDFAGASMGSLGSLFLQQAHGYGTGLTGW
jgi:hypothetical protein